MSCDCAPNPCCTPAQQCAIENFGPSFPSLVGPQGPPGGPGTFVESLAALRVLDATVFVSGYIANVAGYATVNDGGGGLFEYNPVSVSADNDGTIVRPANGIGRWFRMFSGAINPLWFGAVGNNTGDYSAQLQAAINALPQGVLFLPAGKNFRYATGLTVPVGVSFIGEGSLTSKLTYSGAGIAITLNGAGVNSQGLFQDFLLTTTTASPALGPGTHGLRLKNVGRVSLSRVRIRGFSTAGLHLNAEVGEVCLNVDINNCIIEENQDGIIATGGNALINHVTIRGGLIRANVGYNVYGNQDMRDWTLVGANFEAGNTTAVFLNAVLGLSIIGCYFEQIVATPALHLSNNFGASGCSGVIISGNSATGVGGTAFQLGTTSYVSGVNAGGNWFGGTWTTAINGAVRGGMIGPNRVEAGITEFGATLLANSLGLVTPNAAAFDVYAPTSFNSNVNIFQYPTPNTNLQSWKVGRDTLNDEWGIILQSLGFTRAGIRALVENAGNNRSTLKLMVGDGTGALVEGAKVDSNLNFITLGPLLTGGAISPQNTAAKIYSGAGTPEAAVVAAVGSIFLRTNGGAATSIYVKESGAGNVGWVGK